MAKMTVSKFDAIRAQLDAAIEMYFLSENAIATHTLAAAAYNALRDIAKRQGVPHPFIKTDYIDSLPESRRAAVIKTLNEPENFFKHADRDPHATISFDSELTELLLIDAVAYFRETDEPKPRYYDVFKVWVGEVKKETVHDEGLRFLVETVRDGLKAKGKAEFWKFMLQVTAKRPAQ
jgi:hypothetical protein